MTKYANLGKYLQQQQNSFVRMTFREVEGVIGCTLPRSSRYPAWWSNNPSNNVMTKVWLDAGFKTEQVDISGRKLVFRRVGPQQPSTQGLSPQQDARVLSAQTKASMRDQLHQVTAKTMDTSVQVDTPTAALLFHPAYGAMKGLVQIAPGVDLTEPADPNWGKVYE